MHKKINCYKWAKLIYIISLWFFLEAYILGTEKPGLFATLSNLSFIVMFILFLVGSILWNMQNDKKSPGQTIQLAVVFCILAIFWDVNLYLSNSSNINMPIAIIGFVSINLSALIMLGKAFDNYNGNIKNWKNILADYWGIILILLLFGILSIQDFGIWFKSDSYTYYSSLIKNKGTWDFTLNSLSSFLMGGHTAYAYSFFLYIGEYMWHEFGNGMRVVNLIFSEVAIFCFYAICNKLLQRLGKSEKVLLTGIFAFSPLLFGISYIMSSDFPLLCFFIIFVFCYLYDLKILQWLSALAICFSKEIGIVILFGFYIGNCIYRYVSKKHKYNIWGMIGAAFNLSSIFLYSAAFFYLVPIILSNAGWMKNLRDIFIKSSEKADTTPLPNLITKWHYYIYKLEELFVMNFMWIITLLLFITIFVLVIRFFKLKEKLALIKQKLNYIFEDKAVMPLVFSYIMFLAINMLYFTYVHYRYIQLAIFFHILMLGIIIGRLTANRKFRCILLGAILAVFLCESYVTLDPLTHLTMPEFDAGNGKAITTRHYFYGGKNYGYGFIENEQNEEILTQMYLHEGLDYNRQQLGLQYCLEKSFAKINYNSNKLIVLDNFGGWAENTCWSLFGSNSTNGYHWDYDHNTITTDTRYDAMNFVIAQNSFDMNNYDEVYYFDFTFNKYADDDFLEKNEVIDEFDVSCGIWKIKIYRVK